MRISTSPTLRGSRDNGHQAVAGVFSCDDIVLNYASVMYDKSKSKVKIVQEIANELPIPLVASYLLCDSWYTCGIKQKISELVFHLWKTDPDVSLVTVGSRSYGYWYEGSLNDIDDTVVLISYPKNAFHVPKDLWAFISTDVSLSTREILDRYVERWNMEVFFRQSKDKLAFDRYQIRSFKGIWRYWLLMSLAHLLACTSCGETMFFEGGYAYIYSQIQEERLRFNYQCGARHVFFCGIGLVCNFLNMFIYSLHINR